MKRLFVRTLVAVLAALLVLIAVMSSVSALGFCRSLEQWNRTRSGPLEQAAREILLRYPQTISVVVPENAPLFVYDADKRLIFSNRGEGARRRSEAEASASGVSQPEHDGEWIDIVQEGRLLGYYRSGMMHFENDAANSRFLDSLRLTIGLGLLLALLIAVPFALVFSRSLSKPAVILSHGLECISRGDLETRIPEKGAEVVVTDAADERDPPAEPSQPGGDVGRGSPGNSHRRRRPNGVSAPRQLADVYDEVDERVSDADDRAGAKE